MNNLITASRQGSLLSCPRKHYWRYEVGLVAQSDSLALRFGKAWSLAMEAKAKGMDYDDSLAAALPEAAELDELAVATLSGLLAGYFQRYKADTLIKKIHPEVEFRQPLAGSRTFTIAGKMDGLCELQDGRLALKEDKTTSDSVADDSDYWLRLRWNAQLHQYVLAARSLGWDVAIVIYDVTRKPSISPKEIAQVDGAGKKIVLDAMGKRVYKANGEPRESGDTEKCYFVQKRTETPDEFSSRLYEDTLARPEFYFARREVPILDGDLDEFIEQRLTLSRIILHCRTSEKRFEQACRAWPRNVSEMTCRSCSYQSFCLQNLSVDLNQPPVGFTVTDPNQELTPHAPANI